MRNIEVYGFINGAQYLYKTDYDCLCPKFFFALDCGDRERLGRAAEVMDRADITYNIDHHISNTGFGDCNIVNAKASSASEIVYEIIKDNCDITLDIAQVIYSGIVSDTSGFKHNSTSKRTHEIAGELVERGVDTAFIHSKILYEHSFSKLRVMGCALNNAVCDSKYGIAYSALTFEELNRCDVKSGDTDGIAEYLLNTRGVGVSFLLTEREKGKVKISFRSLKCNVNKVASAFGGGGHILAAGASFEGTVDDALKAVLAKLEEEITYEKQQ